MPASAGDPRRLRSAATFAARFLLTASASLCLLAIPGPFTQALVFVPPLLIACAAFGASGYTGTALLNLFLLCLALYLAPVGGMDVLQQEPGLFLFFSGLVAFGGLATAWGARCPELPTGEVEGSRLAGGHLAPQRSEFP